MDRVEEERLNLTLLRSLLQSPFSIRKLGGLCASLLSALLGLLLVLVINQPELCVEHVLIWWGVKALALIAMFAVTTLIFEKFSGLTKDWKYKKWWDRHDKEPDGPVSWQMLFEMCSLEKIADPIAFEDNNISMPDRIRVGQSWVSMFYVFALFIASTVFYSLYFVVVIYDLFPPFLSAANGSYDFKDNLTALLAIVGAVSAVFFANYQLRAKVRADNRQEWINKARKLIAEIITLIPSHWNSSGREKIQINSRLTRKRIELELMLNPSEKDHRLLAYLIRRAAHVSFDIKLDINLRNMVKSEFCSKQEQCQVDLDLHYFIFNEMNFCEAGIDRQNAVISYIIFLSHIVLKREWERVKHTR